jgi:hypothetical protein
VNVSRTFGREPAPRISQYGATRAALEQLTRSWALELADPAIRVNAVAPGPTESEALQHSGLPAQPIKAIKEEERRAIPLGRRGEPEDVAQRHDPAQAVAFSRLDIDVRPARPAPSPSGTGVRDRGLHDPKPKDRRDERPRRPRAPQPARPDNPRPTVTTSSIAPRRLRPLLRVEGRRRRRGDRR